MKGKYLGESKTHYKMYKKGKTWVTMGITLLSVGLGLEFGSSANADAVSDVSNSSNNSSVANKNTSSQANVVQLKSSSAKTSVANTQSSSAKTLVANTQSSSAKASVANTQSSSKQNMSSAVKTASPRESQPINFAVKNSASTVNTTSQQSVYDGQSGEPTNRSQAGKDIQNADSMQIYLINKENGKVLDQREALWNSSSKENNTYYGDNFNGNTSGVTFTSPNGDVTVHPLDGWKFDIPYTEWFDNQRNGVQSTDTIKDDNGNVKATSTDGYWSKEPTSNAITFSFANAQKVTNGTLKHSKDDAIQLFMSPINDNDGNTESHPTPQKDSYQVVINWVNTQYPNNNKNSEDNVPDGQVIGQTVMNLDYGKYGSNGRDVLRGMYNANTNPVGDYQVYAPDGYRFAFPNEVENSYLTSGENGHVARYSTWDQTGHFHWNNYQTVVKVYVTTDSSWKRPANAADGYVPMWKDASTTSKPAASTTVNKPAQQPAASTTANKPAQQP
ncbi:KxYKxGKxW signal peptide domain-containing protein, partial [Ligilactobacillus araffinosus]|uniref:KxYKxGKxW signal peptide domain-containing protein n=1 Tax=Ligilactobacillus araffinosus TaxID=147809 RepID=UPI0019330D31